MECERECVAELGGEIRVPKENQNIIRTRERRINNDKKNNNKIILNI